MTTNRIFYSRREAAELLNLSRRSLDYLLADGRLASSKVGSRRLIHKDSLECFAETIVQQSVAAVH